VQRTEPYGAGRVGPVKCLVWDLDNTIWSGTVLEGGSCRMRRGVIGVLRELDRRGILLSIASANDHDLAVSRLKEKRIAHLFLHPQINWTNKVRSIGIIAKKLNLGLDSVGFIDDEPYERERVRMLLPEVRVYPASDFRTLPERPEFRPAFLTRESRNRRKMYVGESRRQAARIESVQSPRDFALWCDMHLTLRAARSNDIGRVLELLQRTHQLNATGTVYSQKQVRSFLCSNRYRLYVACLEDRFVDYGIIGVAICLLTTSRLRLLSFLLSCRVLGRGIGTVFLSWIGSRVAARSVKQMEAWYRPNDRNHAMMVLFKLSGFSESRKGRDGTLVLRRQCSDDFRHPEWIHIHQGTVI